MNPTVQEPIEVDPLKLQEELQDRMTRYLLTALPIHRRFPDLRKEAVAELANDKAILQGPFLESLPDFPKADSLADLVKRKVLHESFSDLDANVYTRPLHKHQHDAIERIVEKKENILVATGTGSGKTECFFFPMLNELLKAGIDKSQPGIRAILVYPLNALANDQLYSRIVPVLAKELAAHGLTVGRFTGQTESWKTEDEFEQEYLADPRFKELFGDTIPGNWLLSRGQMLKTPPHVLVTNYAMLEHLLLLPQNAPLFKNADLRFLVLDEVHTYGGAQATEVSLLLRKLKNRYAPDRDIRCIGTSASLDLAPGKKEQALEFAGRLFGAEFSDVISSGREPHFLLRGGEAEFTLTTDEWCAVHEILKEARNLPDESQISFWNEKVTEQKIKNITVETESVLPRELCQIFSRESAVRQVSDFLSENDIERLSVVADKIFPKAENARPALRGVVALGAFASDGKNAYPLLPARYHFFARGVEEATVELVQTSRSNERIVNLRFSREFDDPNTKNPRYRLMTCRKCGELYFEAFERGGKLEPEHLGRGWKREVFWVKKGDKAVIPGEATEEEAESEIDPETVFIHLQSREIREALGPDQDPVEWFETHRAELKDPTPEELEENPDTRPRVTTCRSCGSHDSNEIVTRFHPGDHALSTAISEVLYANLPAAKDSTQHHRYPGKGRNMLVFSDNRQDAAFFAPYFQSSHEDLLVRRAVARHLSDHSGKSFPLADLAEDLSSSPELAHGLTDENGDSVSPQERAKVIRGKIFAEFCSPGGSRVSLEDLGIVSVHYPHVPLDEIATRIGISESKGGANLLRWILDCIRRNRAITMPSGISATNEFVWSSFYNQDNRRYTLESKDRSAQWRIIPSQTDNGNYRRNRFVDVMRDVLQISDWDAILRKIWDEFIADPNGYGSILAQDTGSPLFRVLQSALIEIRKHRNKDPIYRCEKCSRISTFTVADLCTQWRCGGKVSAVPSDQWRETTGRNHYHFLYTQLENLPSAVAKEHTAAIASRVREDFERNFKSGMINILSSSTTMEMGIDLGDLEGVMLRNVPPEISNYQQRTGRAGRRAQAAPVAVTYSRNSRYDQSVYEDVERFLESPPKTPFVHLGNPRLFQRHQFSILMSRFLTHEGLDGKGLQVGQMFGFPKFRKDLTPEEDIPFDFTMTDQSRFLKKVTDWLASSDADAPKKLAADLLDSVQAALKDSPDEFARLQIESDHLDQKFAAALDNLAMTFGKRFRFYKEKADRFGHERNFRMADLHESRAKQWAAQPIVNFLTKHGVIPTYSFPVDNVELDVRDGSGWGQQKIELNRDARLGISEYAPGAEVVANGRVWTSRAIPYQPREFRPTLFYKICQNCRHIECSEDSAGVGQKCESCEHDFTERKPRSYIEPTSFSTSRAEEKGKSPGAHREIPPSALESQLIGNAPERSFRGTDLMPVSWAHQHSDTGRLVVINKGKGQGFIKCNQCSYAQAVTQRKRSIDPNHKNPNTGAKCEFEGWSRPFDLAHTFHTDVLQVHVDTPVPVYFPDTDEPATDKEMQSLREGVARTIVESVRQAACEICLIPDREISGTFRWLPNGGLEMVFYDNVPGGAGYTEKIFRDGEVSELFRYAIDHVLTCVDHCSTSCSRCLRSFSNQRHWEEFRRLDAIDYLEKILRLKTKTFAGATQEKRDAILDLCEKTEEIAIFRKRLGSTTGSIETGDDGNEVSIQTYFAELQRLKQWLNDGRKIHAACAFLPDFQAFARPRARRLAEALLHDVRENRLSIRRSEFTIESEDPQPDLILLKPGEPEATVVHDRGGKGAVLDGILSEEGPFYTRRIPREAAEELIAAAPPMDQNLLEPPANISRRKYAAGESRDLSSDFAFLKDHGPVSYLEITDRYLAAKDWSADYFESFMKEIAPIFTVPPKVVRILHGPETKSYERSQWKDRLVEVCQKLEQNPAFTGTRFLPELRSNFQRQNDVHDRRITATIREPTTPAKKASRRQKATSNDEIKVTAELTGGISILMDPSRETSIFVYRE